jgi:glycine C-acetyltransferase
LAFRHSNNYHNFIESELTKLAKNNLYRRLKLISVEKGRTGRTTTATIDGQDNVINLCSNDYLGLSHNHKILRRTILSLKQISQCSSRLIAGNDPKLIELEEQLAEHRATESSLVYPTGYMANLGVITTLADKFTTIISDELNHASIIDGCRLSGAKIKVFRHNDMEHLEQSIQSISSNRKKILVTEGVFSMDGDISNLQQICNLAKEHNAITVIDDAHGDFIFGGSLASSRFSGIPSYLGVNNDIDVHTGSLSKGLGCFGRYVASTRQTRELLINKSRQFIYTSALPKHLCVSALAAYSVATKGNLQKKLFDNAEFVFRKLSQCGFKLKDSRSQIIPVILGQEKIALEFSNQLLDSGIFAQAIRFPTVKKGSARLRISLTALHDRTQLSSAIDSFGTVGKKLIII